MVGTVKAAAQACLDAPAVLPSTDAFQATIEVNPAGSTAPAEEDMARKALAGPTAETEVQPPREELLFCLQDEAYEWAFAHVVEDDENGAGSQESRRCKCQLCGVPILGVVCNIPHAGAVHFGCAASEHQRLYDRRFLKRCRQKLHKDRWEEVRPKKKKKKSKQRIALTTTMPAPPKAAPWQDAVTAPRCKTSSFHGFAPECQTQWAAHASEPRSFSCLAGWLAMLQGFSWPVLRWPFQNLMCAGGTSIGAAMADMRQRREAHLAKQAREEELLAEMGRTGRAEKQTSATFLAWLGGALGKVGCFAWLGESVLCGGTCSVLRRPVPQRVIQKGCRGAHLARRAAARRGVKLAKWGRVCEARRAHSLERGGCLKKALNAMLAFGLCCTHMFRKAAAIAMNSFMPGVMCKAFRTQPQAYPGRLNVTRAKLLSYTLAQQVCSERTLQRVCHLAVFSGLLTVLSPYMPSWIALLCAYGVVMTIATRCVSVHSGNCRGATACAVACGAGLALGSQAALLGAVLVFVVPCAWLWWAPKTLKRPAASDGGTISKRPSSRAFARAAAVATRRPMKRPAQAEGGSPLQGNSQDAPAAGKCKDAPQKAAQAAQKGKAKRPAQDDQATAQWQPLLQQIAEWQASHEGAVPKQTSTDPAERALAKKLSYMPRHLRPGSTSSHEAVHMKLAQEMLAHLEANDGRMPPETLGTAGYLLAQRWRKLERKLEAGMRAPMQLQELLDAVQAARRDDDIAWSPTERVRHRKPILDLQRQLISNYRAWCAAHDQQVRPELPNLQSAAAPGQAFAGSSPYPGFTNLASTCYINSVVQCLFHCHAVREALRRRAASADEPCTSQLAKLLDIFASGVSAAGLDSPAKVDVFAPHEFADFFIAARPRFALGSQHDAADFLSWVLESSTIGHDCCRVGPVPRSEYELIILNEFFPGTSEAALVQGQQINMQTLVSSCLQHDDTKLRMLPPVLLLRMPQSVHGGDDDDHQWVQEEAACYPSAAWENGVFDLQSCCSAECVDRDEAVYRIKAFVQYCRKPPAPSLAISSGHYAAFFEEAGVWYRCDDLRDGALPVALPGPPKEYPYICVFERVGGAAVAPPQLPANPVAARFASQPDAEEISSDSSQCGESEADEEADGQDADDMPSSKRRRRLDKRDRKGRKQKQDRDGRKQKQDRADRGQKQDREGRKQKQDRSGRSKRTEDNIKRARTHGPRSDNTDASRKDIQADADSPVQHHAENVQVLQQAANCRRRFGHIFVLLHLLASTMAADTWWQP